jgi:oxygen-dependent protoporphyrinogen oxidase
MGIPTAPDALRGLVDDATLDRIAVEPDRPLSWRDGDDVSVAELVGDRFGAQTVARSVDPLLGGVYAGLSGSIGVRSALPALAAALDAGAPNLRAAVTAALPPPSTAPVFGGLRDGYRVLLDALRAHVTVRPGAPVTALHRADDGWLIEPFGDRVDAVVVATPAPVAAALLAESAPGLAGLLRRVETASSALVALAVADDTPLPQHSGVLIATDEPLRAKAFTLSSRKWPHLADRPALLARASFGRFGDDRPLRWSDDELVAAAVEDLAAVIDAPVRPLDAVVQRWPDALPQYGPHHTRLVAAIDTALAPFPTLALAGNYLRGVGVPACLAAATAAAAHVAAGRRR